MSKVITITSLSELEKASIELLDYCKDAKLLAFYGEMGAGKTTLIKMLCKLLGVKDTISSPTFSLVNEYVGNNDERIYHFDFYRIESLDEVYDIGYEEYFYSNSYCLIEWSEKVKELIPENAKHIRLTVEEDGSRSISID